MLSMSTGKQCAVPEYSYSSHRRDWSGVGVLEKIFSLGEVWIFSGTTQYKMKNDYSFQECETGHIIVKKQCKMEWLVNFESVLSRV